jgi:hypothetical protein
MPDALNDIETPSAQSSSDTDYSFSDLGHISEAEEVIPNKPNGTGKVARTRSSPGRTLADTEMYQYVFSPILILSLLIHLKKS